jgi:hypothetical protein
MFDRVRPFLELPQKLLAALKRNERAQIIGAAAVGLAIAFGSLWPCLSAQWGLIDDHEIAWFLGPSGKLTLRRFWKMFLLTDGAGPGTHNRFRPTYYLLRLTETYLWGAHPQIWYCARILMFALFLAALIWVLSRYLSLLESALVGAYVAGSFYWIEILTRLGPAEAYAAVGCAIYAVGFARAWPAATDERTQRSSAAAILVGGVIALGAKEVFIFLLAPTGILALRALFQGRTKRWVLVASLLVSAFGLFVAISVLIGVRKLGHIYGRDTSSSGFRDNLILGVRIFWPAVKRETLVVLALAVAAIVYLVARRRAEAARELTLRSLACAGGIASLLLFYGVQTALYSGRWPGSDQMCCHRYDFPGLLATPLIYCIEYYWLLCLLRLVGIADWLLAWLRAGVIAWGLIHIPFIATTMRAQAHYVVEMTQHQTALFNALRDKAKEHPDWPILIESHAIDDYEPIASLQRFMNSMGVKNARFLKLYYDRSQVAPDMVRLAAWLEDKSSGGSPTDADVNFYPLAPLSQFPGAPCFSIRLGAGPHDPHAACTQIY